MKRELKRSHTSKRRQKPPMKHGVSATSTTPAVVYTAPPPPTRYRNGGKDPCLKISPICRGDESRAVAEHEHPSTPIFFQRGTLVSNHRHKPGENRRGVAVSHLDLPQQTTGNTGRNAKSDHQQWRNGWWWGGKHYLTSYWCSICHLHPKSNIKHKPCSMRELSS